MSTVRQVIARHAPSFDVAGARLGIGRDGMVYVASSGTPAGTALRLTPEGVVRATGSVGSLLAVTANGAGVVATAEHHFAHRVAFWDTDFRPLGAIGEFTVNDTDDYYAPSAVEAGQSGDFYAMDQHALRVLRLNPGGVTGAIALTPPSSDPKEHRPTVGLRVAEDRQRLYVAWQSGVIQACTLTGAPVWAVRAKPAGYVLSGFDVAPDGRLHVLSGGRQVQVFDVNGHPAAPLTLALPDDEHDVTDLRILGEEILVRRCDQVTPPTRADRETLFERYDLHTGALIGQVFADVERLTVAYDSDVWEAGTAVPLTVTHDPGRWASEPRLKVWLRPLGVPEFTEIPLSGGTVTPPAGARGLHQLRVTPDIGGQYSEYVVDSVIEIRTPGSRGTLSIWAPSNRFHYGRGEPIAGVRVQARAMPGTPLPGAVRVRLLRDGAEAAGQDVTLENGTRELAFGADVTARLEPGRYVLDADLPGWTVAPQYLAIGPGLTERPRFHLVQYDDIYAMGFPSDPRRASQSRKLDDLPLHRDMPEVTEAYVARARTLGLNLFVHRALTANTYADTYADGGIGAGTDHSLERRLRAPGAVAPAKGLVEDGRRRAIAALGAHGMETQAILLANDAYLPFGPAIPGNYENRSPEALDRDIQEITRRLLPYAAFRGWTWGANWWLGLHGEAAATASELDDYRRALAEAEDHGTWSAMLDTVSDRVFALKRDAEARFRAALKAVKPDGVSAMTGPYREPQLAPRIALAGADEIDLHFQAEQIQPPQVTGHMVDFYRGPGRPVWGHPELVNDDGTGAMFAAMLLQQVMRGANGTGTVTDIGAEHLEGLFAQDERGGGSGGVPGDPRSGSAGKTSVLRALFGMISRLGPVTAGARSGDPVAIVVSTRMQRVEASDGYYASVYFQRLYEAWNACLYAHRPASFVFTEDVSAEVLGRYQAVLLVGQTVEPDPPLAAALREVRARVFADGTCRDTLVSDFRSLGISFDRIETIRPLINDDSIHERVRAVFLEHAGKLRTALNDTVKPFAECDNPEVHLSEWTSGGVRYLWAVNNTMLDWDPGLAWRVGLLCAHRVPVMARIKVRLPLLHQVVDLLTGKPVTSVLGGEFTADLRTTPARLHAVVPLVHGTLPSASEGDFGPHVRDIAVSPDGRSAALTAFAWDHNVYGLDLATGRTTWRQRIGHHFAYAPAAHTGGFAAQGFDLHSAEGYHLYLLGPSGQAPRRFALFGLPKRATDWARSERGYDLGLNNFAVPPGGSWVATSGDLGLAVWDSSGAERWAHEWWARDQRTPLRLLAADDDTLITFAAGRITGLSAADGSTLWSLDVARTGSFGGGVVSADRGTVVIWSDTDGGRLFVVRGGALVHTIPAAAGEVSVSGDGSLIAATEHRRLKVFSAESGLLWTYTGDDLLRRPRVSPDGTRIAVGSELGTLAVLTRDGTVEATADLKALPVPAWLPGGDLLAATWMGRVVRYGPGLRPRWQSGLAPTETDIRPKLRAPDPVPVVRRTGWGNASATPRPLTPNLITQTKALIRARLVDKERIVPLYEQNPIGILTDGSPDPPAKPWLPWNVVNAVDSGWNGKFELSVDTVNTQVELEAVTFAEDPAHPESWLRDVRVQWWDAEAGRWADGPMLLSDTAVHSHTFRTPPRSARFRFVTTGGGAWPAGNLRLGELVLHGRALGTSHRDVVARRDLAVLFDDRESDLNTLWPGVDFQRGGAHSGGTCLRLNGPVEAHPTYIPGFGHVVPDWDFEIVEHPEPGQYRWFQFAWKAAGPETTGMGLRIGRGWDGVAVTVLVGDSTWPQGTILTKVTVPGRPPAEWTTVRMDLWELTGGRLPRVISTSLRSNGGGALFDQFLLARSPDHFPDER
jgi:hypothetical protein